MGLFDGVQKQGQTVRGAFGPATAVKSDTGATLSAAQIAQQKTTLENRDIAGKDVATQKKVALESPLFPGMSRSPSVIHTESNPIAGNMDILNQVNSARTLFSEKLSDALFVGKIVTFVTEAAPIEDSFKHRHDAQEAYFNCAMEMWKEVKTLKNVAEEAEKNMFPYTINEIYSLCVEAAEIESAHRFNIQQIQFEMGNNIEKIHEFLQSQINTMSIESTPGLREQFEIQTNRLIAESEDIIDSIKTKVTSQLDKYKENVGKLNAVKSAMKQSDPDMSGAKANGGTDDSSGDISSDTSDDSGTKTDGDNGDTGSSTDTGSGEGDAGAGAKDASGEPENTDANTDQSASTDNPPSDDGKTKEGDSNPDAKTEENGSISEEDSSAINDAASFAEAHDGTFNLGDEKFGGLYSSYVDRFKKASAANDVDELAKLGSVVKTAAARIKTISEGSNKKYENMSQKLSGLSDEVQFEVSKRIKGMQQEAVSRRTVLEGLIIGVANRYYEKISLEGGTVEAIPGDSVLKEALSYYTTLETFNTLKLFDLARPKDRACIDEFLSELKK